MSQIMQCPLCSGEMTITPDIEGRDVCCPHCRQEIHIPGPPVPSVSGYQPPPTYHPVYQPRQKKSLSGGQVFLIVVLGVITAVLVLAFC